MASKIPVVSQAETPLSVRNYQFDGWRVFTDACELIDPDGNAHKIEPRLMVALGYLLEHGGQVISREQLMDAVWSGNVVVSDHSLTQLLGGLRKVLGDSPRAPRYIETIPKKGYRFIAEVEHGVTAVNTPTAETTRPPVAKPSRSMLWILPLGVALLILLGLAYFRLPEQAPVQASAGPLAVERLTQYPGVERYPAVSPDGLWLAFSWEDYQMPGQLFIKSLADNAAKPIELTQGNTRIAMPTWSPDASHIAFVRMTGEAECAVVKIHVQTRQETYLTRCDSSQFAGNSLEWAPNGDIYFKAKLEGEVKRGIGILKPDGSTRLLPCRLHCDFDDMDISWSPTGEHFVVTRQISLSGQDMFLYSADSRQGEVRISFDEVQILGHDFSDDGNTLYYATFKAGPPQLWQYDLTSKQHKALLLDSDSAVYPSMVHGKNRLVFSRQERTFYIAQVALEGNNANLTPLVQSYASNFDPAVANSTRQMAYTSGISGQSEIWLTDTDSSAHQQITDSKIGALSPTWSADGSKLAYVLYHSREEAVIGWRDMQTGQQKVLESDLSGLWAPQFSHDQQSVYVSAVKQGKRHIWRMPLAGESVEAVSGEGAFVVKVDTRSGNLFYSKEKTDGLFYYDLDKQQETLVTDRLKTNNLANWVAYGERIYYLDSRNNKDSIMEYHLADKQSRVVTTLAKNSVAQYMTGSFSIRQEPDGAMLVFVHNGILQSDLLAVTLE